MSTTAKNKLLTGLVILLLIANIATLVFFWMGMKKREPHPGKQGSPSAYLIEKLSFNKDQQTQYEALVKQHREQVKQLHEQTKAVKDSFFDLLQSTIVNDSLQNHLANEIAALNKQTDLITFNHFKEVRKICTPDQQKEFDKILKDILHMMSGPGPQGKRPEGPPPGDKGMHDGPPPGEDGPPPGH